VERKLGSPKRQSRELVDKEVLEWFLDEDKPIRWTDLEKKSRKAKMSTKTLSAALKRLRDKDLITIMTIDDEHDRPTVHYRTCPELVSAKELRELWLKIYANAHNQLAKKGLSKRQRTDYLKDILNTIFAKHIATYFITLDTAIKTHDDEKARQKFAILFSTLMTDPSSIAFFLVLENRDIADQVLKEIREDLLNAPQSQGGGRKKGGKK
jgi:DNA-binding HxlR family transcriptional regulator